MEKVILESVGVGGYPEYRIPGIARSGKGTLFAYCECRYGNDWGVIDIGLRRSEDHGRTWSERQIVVSGLDRNTTNNPVMFVSGDLLILMFCRNYAKAYTVISRDDGKTWSQPTDVSYVFESFREEYPWTCIAVGPGHGITLKSGRLLAPVWFAMNVGDIHAHRPSVIATVYSDDGGKTWLRGEIIYANDEFVNPSECALAELSDGTVAINCRHEGAARCRGWAISKDGISDWTVPVMRSDLPDPVCFGSMTYGDGCLYTVNCHNKEARRDLWVQRSDDDGATWSKRVEVTDLAGYSDIILTAEGNLCCYFEDGRPEPGKGMNENLAVVLITPSDFIENV